MTFDPHTSLLDAKFLLFTVASLSGNALRVAFTNRYKTAHQWISRQFSAVKQNNPVTGVRNPIGVFTIFFT